MKKRCGAMFVAAFLAATCATAAESDSVVVHVNPSDSLLWHTVMTETFTVAWDLPPGATKATLSISGYAYSATYPDITDTYFEVTVPKATNSSGENVYEFTLTFDDNTTLTTYLGTITGVGTGGSLAKTRVKSHTSLKWNEFSGHIAVPLLPGTSYYALNSVQDQTVDGYAGWRLLRYEAGVSSYELDMTADGIAYSADLTGNAGGMVFVVR